MSLNGDSLPAPTPTTAVASSPEVGVNKAHMVSLPGDHHVREHNVGQDRRRYTPWDLDLEGPSALCWI